MQSFTNFTNVDLGFPNISSTLSNSRRDNSIKNIEADCRACLQYYQQKQADRQKHLLLSNRKRAMNQWKKLQGDRIMGEETSSSEDNKDQYYYHSLVNESTIKKKVECVFPGAEKLPGTEYDGETFNISFAGKRTQSIKTDNGPKYKFRNCIDGNAISDTREIMSFRQNFNAAHMEACKTSFSVSSSSAAGAEPIILREPDLLEDATFNISSDECFDMEEMMSKLQNSICENDRKSFFTRLHSWKPESCNIEDIPNSMLNDKVGKEFARLFFQQTSAPFTSGALEAMNTALPSFSYPLMTSAPLPDGPSGIKKTHPSISAAASSSSSSSRAFTMPQTQTLHIPDFSSLALPISSAWIPVLRNTWTKDDKVLRVIPYLGEEKEDNDDDEAKVDLSCCKSRAVTVCGEAEESTVLFIMDKYGNGLGHANGLPSSSATTTCSSSDSSPLHDNGNVDRDSDVYQALSNVLGISCKELYELYKRFEESGRKRAFSLKKSGKAVDHYQHAVDFDQVNRDCNLHRLLQASSETTANEIAESKLDSGLGIFLGNNRNVDSLSDENYRYFFCRRCYSYCCSYGDEIHPFQQALPISRVDPLPPFPCPFPGISLPTDAIRRNLKDDSSSSNLNARANITVSLGRKGKTVAAAERGSNRIENNRDNRNYEESEVVAGTDFIDGFKLKDDSICYVSSASSTAVAQYIDPETSSSSANRRMHADDDDYDDDEDDKQRGDCDGEQGQNVLLSMAIPFDLFIGKVKDVNNYESKESLTDVEKGLAEKIFCALLGLSTAVAGTESLALHQAFLTYVDTHKSSFKSYSNPLEACAVRVAALLRTRPVATVLDFIQQLISKSAKYAQSESSLPTSKASDSKGPRSKGKQKCKVSKISKKTSIRTKNKFDTEFQPCHHSGPCNGNNCSCAKGEKYCEKYCACDSRICGRAFKGCTCKAKAGRCSTQKCPCVGASRECDPDLCGDCGASIHPIFHHDVEAFLQRGQNGTNNNSTAGNYALPCGTVKPVILCKNTQLTCRKRRKLLIGRSEIHGWGAFANEEIQKNDFITEYTGELISHDEAERRGRVYDGMNSNFLFSLNDYFVVDSTRKGNKARMINHSQTDPNCFPKIMQVGGDHRVAIYAARNLQPGEELTFDYGKNFTSRANVDGDGQKSSNQKSQSSSKDNSTSAFGGGGGSSSSSSSSSSNNNNGNSCSSSRGPTLR